MITTRFYGSCWDLRIRGMNGLVMVKDDKGRVLRVEDERGNEVEGSILLNRDKRIEAGNKRRKDGRAC